MIASPFSWAPWPGMSQGALHPSRSRGIWWCRALWRAGLWPARNAARRGRRGSQVKGGACAIAAATPKAPLTWEGRPRRLRHRRRRPRIQQESRKTWCDRASGSTPPCWVVAAPSVQLQGTVGRIEVVVAFTGPPLDRRSGWPRGPVMGMRHSAVASKWENCGTGNPSATRQSTRAALGGLARRSPGRSAAPGRRTAGTPPLPRTCCWCAAGWP